MSIAKYPEVSEMTILVAKKSTNSNKYRYANTEHTGTNFGTLLMNERLMRPQTKNEENLYLLLIVEYSFFQFEVGTPTYYAGLKMGAKADRHIMALLEAT
ncbi:hypothetical protein FKM82_012955 [Ascaphus truei]